MNCKVCGSPTRSKRGICTRNDDCRREHQHARYVARPRRALSEKELASRRLYKKNHPDAVRAEKRRSQGVRRARRMNVRHYTIDDRVLFKVFGSICGLCGKPITGPYHVDHIIPLSKGGSHTYDNVQLSHPLCNQKKYNKIDYDPNQGIAITEPFQYI